jgi:phage gpG-like protein
MNQNFQMYLQNAKNRINELIPKITGIIKVEGLQFIADNFDNQGFEQSPGKVLKWSPRKPSKNKKLQKREGRQILVDSGKLRRAWESKSRVTKTKVIFANNMPYAEVHNEGGKAGRGKGFMMPQRQMIGDSSALDQRINPKINKIMDTIFK